MYGGGYGVYNDPKCSQRPEEKVKFPGVIGSCEPLTAGARTELMSSKQTVHVLHCQVISPDHPPCCLRQISHWPVDHQID